MKARIAVVGLLMGVVFSASSFADGCVVHYVRTACQGMEAESFKKCDGQAECEKSKPADSAEACSAAALKSCDNSRLDITKYKVITAKFNGEDLVGEQHEGPVVEPRMRQARPAAGDDPVVIQQVEVDGDYLLDNGYAVAWQPSLQWEMTRARRKIRAFLFGDQLLLRFRGRGTLWVQSRSPHTLANFAHPYRPVKRNND